jgi:hypothetical protein
MDLPRLLADLVCAFLVGSEFGQLFAYKVDVCVVRVHVYILYGHNLCETVVSDLKLSASTSEEVDELFRLALAAAWP